MKNFYSLVIFFMCLLPGHYSAQFLQIALPATVCIGDTLVPLITITTPSNTSYVWVMNPPELITPTVSLPNSQVNITFTSCGAHTLTCYAYQGSVFTSSATATINAICPSLTVTPAVQTICTGESATISVTGASSFTWSTSQVTSAITPTLFSTTTYSVVGNLNQCEAKAIVFVQYAPLSIFASANTACPNSTIYLSPIGQAFTYIWTGSTLTSPVVQPTLGVGPGTYTASTIAGSAACSATITIGVAPPLNVTVSLSSPTTCIKQNNPARLSKPVTIVASGATNYSWTPYNPFGPGPLNVVQPTVTTCYTVTGTTPNCSGTAAVCVSVIPQFTFDVESKLYRFGAYSGPTLCRLVLGSLNVTNISTLAIGPVSSFSYSWNFPSTISPPGFSVSGQSTPSLSFVPLYTFTYTAEISDSLGCISAANHATAYVWICEFWDSGLKSNELTKDLFTIYPNPTKDFLSVQCKTEIPTLQIDVSDLLGKAIVTTSLDHKDADNLFHLDLRGLKPGVYFVSIFSEDKVLQTSKVIKQ